MRRLPGVILAIALLVSGPAYSACRVEPSATVPVELVNGLFRIAVAVNGNPVRFVLDTGAERTVLSLAAADRVHLRRDEWVSTDMQGAGGRDRRRLGRPDSLTVGGVALRRHTIAADNSIVVGPLSDGIDGLLGEDFLSSFDIDLDAASGKLTLFTVSGCSGRFLPWSGKYDVIAAWRPVRNILAVPLRIGGKPLWAELDTGANQTTITFPGMIELGLAAGGSGSVAGFGSRQPRRAHGALRRSASWWLAGGPHGRGDRPPPPPLRRTLRSIGALLGTDWLVARHVWISWATDQIFVAPPRP